MDRELARGAEDTYEDLAEALKTLGSAARLEILARLRFPTPIRELEVAPRRHRPHENPDRAMAIATLQAHLRKLREQNIVVELDPVDSAARFVVNRARLYALAEVFRDLAVVPGGHVAATDETLATPGAGRAKTPAGPRVTLVHGAYEGRAFALDPSRAVEGAWTIGRLASNTVCLDYDPYVSRVHARIELDGERHVLVDSGQNQNGTRVNWTPLPPGGGAVLRPGDVIGVGRSLLVFATS